MGGPERPARVAAATGRATTVEAVEAARERAAAATDLGEMGTAAAMGTEAAARAWVVAGRAAAAVGRGAAVGRARAAAVRVVAEERALVRWARAAAARVAQEEPTATARMGVGRAVVVTATAQGKPRERPSVC